MNLGRVGQSETDLILDSSGTPTGGRGTCFKQHLICRLSSTGRCKTSSHLRSGRGLFSIGRRA
jgi:hypothetical protein